MKVRSEVRSSDVRVGGFGSGSSLSEVLDGGVQGLAENQLRRAGGGVRSEVEDQKMQQKNPQRQRGDGF